MHALLESQRRQGRTGHSGLEDITESLVQGSTPSTATKYLDEPVDQKGGNEGEGRKGDISQQEDERIWRDRLDSKDSGDAGEKVEVEVEEPNSVHSRLLTKKQLSDMAWGVRELSKRLGSIRLKLKVKTVFLLTKAHDESLIVNTREVARWLLSPERNVKYTVWVEENLRDNKKFDAEGLLAEIEESSSQQRQSNGNTKNGGKRLRYWNNNMCRTKPHNFDFVITLGGDGTVLYASWLFQRIVPPVLSFALGSLGFLTKFDYDNFRDILTKAFTDGVTISLRLRFEGTVMRSQKRKRKGLDNGGDEADMEEESHEIRDLVEELVGEEKEDERTHRPDGTYEILNDIVVDRGPNPSTLSEFHVVVIFADTEP